MNRPEPPDLASLSADQARWVNSICNDFEDHWERAVRPAVQDYMTRAGDDVDAGVRLVLLRELLTSELALRDRDAQVRGIDAYGALFSGPGERAVIDLVLKDEAMADGRRRFRIVRLHARGGLGEVFVAHDGQLDRSVALKRMRPELGTNEMNCDRFIREAEITGRLEHPNIAPVYSLGFDGDKLPFYAMRFIDGQPLEKAIYQMRESHTAGAEPGARQFALRNLLTRFNAVCDAVAFAHSKGILHRDIKPANIIVGRFGETILADWGLAKRMDVSETDSRGELQEQGVHGIGPMTERGSVLGTLVYMSPEQALSSSGPLGPASDIYSLGATLYHLLTGRAPFSGDDPEKLRQQVISGDFLPPRAVDSTIARALEAVVIKAMAREPGERYARATAVRDDIEHWLADEAVTAWSEPIITRIRRRLRPYRTAVAGVAAALVVATIGLAGFSLALQRQQRQTAAERNRAERARDVAFSAVQAIVLTDKDEMLAEENLPVRAILLDEGLRLSREMIKGAENDVRSQQLRAQALMMEAKILGAQGDRDRADESGKRAVEILERSVALAPSDGANREWLAHLMYQYGTTARDPETRRSNALRSNEIYLRMLDQAPESGQAPGWIGYIATNLHNVGNEFFAESQSATGEKRLGLLSKAIEAFREGRRFCGEQAHNVDRRNRVLFPLALNERYLCRAYRDLAKLIRNPPQSEEAWNEAIEWGKHAVVEFQALADMEPGNYQRGWELHEAQRELGIAFFDAGRGDEAVEVYKKARETLKMLRERHGKLASRMAWLQENIAVDDFNLLNVLNGDEAAQQKLIGELADEAYVICEKLDIVRPLSLNLRRAHAYLCFGKANLNTDPITGLPDIDLNRRAASLYQKLVDENPAELVPRGNLFLVRLQLADALDAHGRGSESRAAENDAFTAANGRVDILFQGGYVYATSSQAVDKVLATLDAGTRRQVKERCAARVVPLLRKAVASGFKDAARLREDPAFAPFQSDPEFQSVVLDAQFPSEPFAPR